MDSVDDLFPPYQLAHWDTSQFPPFPAPPAPSPDALPDPTAAMFPSDANDHVSIHDPNQLPLDISPVTAGLGSFPLPNPLSFLSNPSPNSQPVHLQQQFPNPIHYSPPQNSAAQQQQSHIESEPQSAHNHPHSQQQLSHHSPSQALTQPPSHLAPQAIRQPSHVPTEGTTQSSQQDFHPIPLHHAQHPPTSSMPPHNSQQYSHNSQMGLLQPHQRQHSNTMQSSVEAHMPHSSQASHHQPLAIDSNQPQLSLHAPQHQRTALSSQQQQADNRHDIQQQQLHLQYRIQQSTMLPQQQQKQAKAPVRRKPSSQQRQQNSTTASQRKHQTQTVQAQKRQSGLNKAIGKQKVTRQVKQPVPTGRPQKQQQAQPDFGLLAAQHDSQVVQNRRSQPQQQQQTQQSHSQQQHHQQQSQQHLFSAMTAPGSSMPAVSSISIPTPTIATGTTITGTPSATNSTHRSPPHTPHSSNRGKSSTVSAVPETQSDMHSSMDKSTDTKHARLRQSMAATNGKNSQSSSKLNLQATGAASASAQHAAGVGAVTRVTKPRDKQAKLRKRLKCCTADQLIEVLVALVRSNAVPDKVVTDSIGRVDINSYVSRCKVLQEAIYAQLPEDRSNATLPYDSEAHRRCKKALATFKTTVTNIGKTLVEANLWTDVIRYCVSAAEVNDRMPVWSEANHNKSRSSVQSKLEQFAMKAASHISKSKQELFTSPNEQMEMTESCRKSFPAVATKLEYLKLVAVVESEGGRAQDFDPMISNTRLDLAM